MTDNGFKKILIIIVLCVHVLVAIDFIAVTVFFMNKKIDHLFKNQERIDAYITTVFEPAAPHINSKESFEREIFNYDDWGIAGD